MIEKSLCAMSNVEKRENKRVELYFHDTTPPSKTHRRLSRMRVKSENLISKRNLVSCHSCIEYLFNFIFFFSLNLDWWRLFWNSSFNLIWSMKLQFADMEYWM